MANWRGTRPRVRCVLLILAGLAVLIAAPFLASDLASVVLSWGLALALAVAPVGFVLSVRDLLSRRLQWSAAVIPLVIAGIYWLAWETRDRCG